MRLNTKWNLGYRNRFEKVEGRAFSLADADYVVCHSPYNKVIKRKALYSKAKNLYNFRRTWMIFQSLYSITLSGVSACAKKLRSYYLQ